MSNYKFVQLSSTTISRLDELYTYVYGKKPASNHYRLKYATAFTGVEYIGFFAFEKNIPVAYYGVVPVLVSINGTPVLAAQSCDTMTHPDFRKKGLFTELATLTFELAKKEGIHFVFGFPNQNSYHGLVEKLEFTHLETMNRYTMSYSENLFKKLYRKYRNATVKKQRTLVSNILLEQGHDGVLYSQQYFDYKAYNRNFTVANPSGLLWINQSDALWIGAISSAKEEEIIEQFLFIEKSIKAKSATFIVSPDTLQDNLFRTILKPEKGFATTVKNLSNIHILDKLKFQFSDIDIF